MNDPDPVDWLNAALNVLCLDVPNTTAAEGYVRMLERVRDEIVALRKAAGDAHADLLSKAEQIIEARAEALEEAARLCDEIQREVECRTLSAGRPFIDPEAAWRCAAAIRALKDERHE